MLPRIGRNFAVFVGLVLTTYGLWIFSINIVGAFWRIESNPWWILAVVLVAGILSATGGVLFVLSFRRVQFQTRRVRSWGVALMILGSLLPTSLTAILLLLALLMVPTIFVSFPSKDAEISVTSE